MQRIIVLAIGAIFFAVPLMQSTVAQNITINQTSGNVTSNGSGVTGTPVVNPIKCDPSYPDFCIKPPPPDLNCANITEKNFKVVPPDPHKFDADKDGIGCES